MIYKNLIIGLSLLLTLLFLSCGLHEKTQDENLQELEQLAAYIDRLVGDAPCDDPSDCRIIAFGSKPCGGPWGYKVYSIIDTDTLLLAKKVDYYNQMDDAYNKKWGILSDCSIAPVPKELICEDGHCVAVY